MALQIEEQCVDSLSSMEHKLSVKNFIWSEEEWPAINHDEFTDAHDIPVISLREISDGRRSPNYEKVCKAMVSACEKWGFFKLVDHGVALEIIESFKGSMNELFDLPMEQKLKGARSARLPLGYCATNPDYGKNLPWAEILQLLQSPQMVVGFAKKVFGDQHQPFSDAMVDYLNALDNLGMTILEMLAHGLGLPENIFTNNFEAKEATMIRVNRYPPCPLPEKCLGLGSHSDPHTLTILLQDDVGGLQVLMNDDKWIGIRPVPNSFIINIGDTLEAWTNGRLKSVVHRAVVNKEKNRLSAAYFMSPSDSAILDPHTLTILLQDDVGGLQVLMNDDKWIGIRPVPNSFIINIGDTLEAWTNGRLKSVVHRAVVNKEKNRLSAAYFMSPSESATIETPPELVDPLINPRKYESFTWGDFKKQLLVQKRVVGKTALLRYHISN